jgi:hypothetical protein
MASPGTPDPTQSAQPSPGQSSPGSAPSQAPASPEQIMLAKLYQACKALAQQNPTLAPGLSKAAEGIQEAQTAMVTQPAPAPTGQTPPY